MKPKHLTSVIIFLAICFSCDKSEFPSRDLLLDEINYGVCKSITKSVLEESLELTTINDYYLAFSHINAMFNCAPGQIIVNATLEDNIISINEYSTENSVNCICPYDLSFSIGPLQYDTYTLSVKQANYEILNIEIDFNNNTDLKIDIEKTN